LNFLNNIFSWDFLYLSYITIMELTAQSTPIAIVQNMLQRSTSETKTTAAIAFRLGEFYREFFDLNGPDWKFVYYKRSNRYVMQGKVRGNWTEILTLPEPSIISYNGKIYNQLQYDKLDTALYLYLEAYNNLQALITINEVKQIFESVFGKKIVLITGLSKVYAIWILNYESQMPEDTEPFECYDLLENFETPMPLEDVMPYVMDKFNKG